MWPLMPGCQICFPTKDPFVAYPLCHHMMAAIGQYIGPIGPMAGGFAPPMPAAGPAHGGQAARAPPAPLASAVQREQAPPLKPASKRAPGREKHVRFVPTPETIKPRKADEQNKPPAPLSRPQLSRTGKLPATSPKPLRPQAGPIQVYILSYSVETGPHNDAYRKARNHVSPTAKRIPTIECEYWMPPPQEICMKYSGVSGEVQQWMLRNEPRSIPAINNTISTIVNTLSAEVPSVYLKTSCRHGTHRSVSMAEIVGQNLAAMGYRVLIMHPHRVKMVGDAR